MGSYFTALLGLQKEALDNDELKIEKMTLSSKSLWYESGEKVAFILSYMIILVSVNNKKKIVLTLPH